MGKSRELPDDGFESFFEDSSAKRPSEPEDPPRPPSPHEGTNEGGASKGSGVLTTAVGAIAIVALAWWVKETNGKSSQIEKTASDAETVAIDARDLASEAETKAISAESSAQLAKVVADGAKQAALEADTTAGAAKDQASRAEIRAQELVGRLGDFTQLARLSADDALQAARGARDDAQQALVAVDELKASIPDVTALWEQQAQASLNNASTQAENAILLAREASLTAANAERQAAEISQDAESIKQSATTALERVATLESQLALLTEKLDEIGTVENWSTLPLADAWDAYNGEFPNPGFRRDWSGTTRLRGALKRTEAEATTLIARLPSEIAPEETVRRRVAVGNGTDATKLIAAFLRIEPNGEIHLDAPAGVSADWALIDGITFSSKR